MNKSTIKRANRAFSIILSNRDESLGSRAYDNCFEMGDRKNVVIALVTLAKQYQKELGINPFESYPACRYVDAKGWEKTWLEGSGD